MIYYPKYLIVLDPQMPEIMDVTTGLVSGGVVVYNTSKKAEEAAKLFKVKFGKIAVVDATGIAQRVIGRPIPNTVMLGAFAKTTGLLKPESIYKAIEKRFPAKLATANKDAVKIGYETVEVKML